MNTSGCAANDSDRAAIQRTLSMLRALIWDVDGTIAETERDGHRIAFNQALEELGAGWQWDVQTYGDLLRVTG